MPRQPAKSRLGKFILWAVGGLGAFAAMGVPMIAMMVFMGQMTNDINRGTNTFTQPWNLMRNTMPW